MSRFGLGDLSFIDRFLDYVEVGYDDECWEWTGYRDRNDHAKFYVLDRYYYAAAIMYWVVHKLDDIPDKVRHKCDHNWCCNPHHLWLED